MNEEIDGGSSERDRDHRSLEWGPMWMNSQPTGEEDTAFPAVLGSIRSPKPEHVTGREMLWLPHMCTGVPLGEESRRVFTRGRAQINNELWTHDVIL